MAVGEDTIWARLEECVGTLHEPFTAAQIMSWFRRHYPDVKETSLRAHIQSANSTSPDRGTLGYRPPLITRVQHGTYVRANHDAHTGDIASEPNLQDEPTESIAAPTESANEWHVEAQVQSAVVTYLATNNWQVQSVSDTAARSHGIDIVAVKDGITIGVEVKGFPSKRYSDPSRAHETKPTQPATQARVWFASALLASLRLRTRQPSMVSVIALPEFVTYKSLYQDTKRSLDLIGVRVWWVAEDGRVTPDDNE